MMMKRGKGQLEIMWESELTCRETGSEGILYYSTYHNDRKSIVVTKV